MHLNALFQKLAELDRKKVILKIIELVSSIIFEYTLIHLGNYKLAIFFGFIVIISIYVNFKIFLQYSRYRRIYKYSERIAPQSNMGIEYSIIRPDVIKTLKQNDLNVKERKIYFDLYESKYSEKLNVTIKDEMKCDFKNDNAKDLIIPKVFHDNNNLDRLKLYGKLGRSNVKFFVNRRNDLENIIEFKGRIKPLKSGDATLNMILEINNGFSIGQNNTFIIDPYLLESNTFTIILNNVNLIENYTYSLYRYSTNQLKEFSDLCYEFDENKTQIITEHSKDYFYILLFQLK